MQINGEGLPTGQPPAGSGDPNPPANQGSGQGDPGTNPQPQGGEGSQQPPAPQQKDPEDLDGLKSALAQERKNVQSTSASLRELQKKFDQVDKQLKEIEDSKKDDLTKAQEQAAEANKKAEAAMARARTTSLRYEIARHATALGFYDPEDAYVHLVSSKIDFNDQDEPQGVEQLVKDLATTKPHLVKSGDGQQTPQGNPAPKPTPVSALTGTQTTPDVDEQRKQEMGRQVRTML